MFNFIIGKIDDFGDKLLEGSQWLHDQLKPPPVIKKEIKKEVQEGWFLSKYNSTSSRVFILGVKKLSDNVVEYYTFKHDNIRKTKYINKMLTDEFLRTFIIIEKYPDLT